MKIVFPTDINYDVVVISVIFSKECCGVSFECQALNNRFKCLVTKVPKGSFCGLRNMR